MSQEILSEKSSLNKTLKLEKMLNLISVYDQIVSGLSLLLLARFISDTLNVTISSYCALTYYKNWERALLESLNSLGFFLNLLNLVIHLDKMYEDIRSLSRHLLEIEFQSEDDVYIRYSNNDLSHFLILYLENPQLWEASLEGLSQQLAMVTFTSTKHHSLGLFLFVWHILW